MTAEEMRRWRTSVDLAGERPVGENPYKAGADGHSTHHPPTPEERATARERMLWQALDHEMRERERAETIVGRLRTELALYRPEPGAAEPAPKVPGYWLVTVAAHTGVCYAVNVREPYPGGGLPDFDTPARRTLCGKTTVSPAGIPGYGWPPASTACAKCRAALPAAGPVAQLALLDQEAS